MVRLLRRVPVWLWVFVAATQVLSIPRVVHLLSFPNSEVFASLPREAYWDLVGICVLLPLSVALAVWRWRVGPPPAAAERSQVSHKLL
jgi:hypothetical protein